MNLLARYAIILPAVLVMAIYVPTLFDLAFGERVKKTHLFYSPVLEKFIYRDKVLDLDEHGLEDAHHAQFVQMDEDGKHYTREEFEQQLPFIYYKNMDLWGMLPLELKGRSFDKAFIRDNRQVIELKPEQITGRSPDDEVFPLIDSAPQIANLVFPEDRFRLDEKMEFINADYNKPDEALTRIYTKGLRDAGFVFPGQLIACKPSILKPFDEGVFLVDAQGSLFHVKREREEPVIIKTPVDPAVGIRSLKVSENSRRDFYGLVLAEDDTLYVMTYDDYKLIPLPLEGYDPDSMDFKLISNPLYRTALYSDQATIRAVAMDIDYTPIASYEHTMPGAYGTFAQRMFNRLVPFSVAMSDVTSGFHVLKVLCNGWKALPGIGLALGLFALLHIRKSTWSKDMLLDGVLVFVTGVYGLAAITLLPRDT